LSSHVYAAAAEDGASNDTLFLYGGRSLINEPMSLVYTFGKLLINNKVWWWRCG